MIFEVYDKRLAYWLHNIKEMITPDVPNRGARRFC